MAKTKTAPKKRTAKKAATSTTKTAKKPAASKTPAKRAAKKKVAKKSPAKKKATKKEPATEVEVTIDRRRTDRREEQAEEQKLERREKVNRRRQIDPTTCEREYSDAEVEFMSALDDYKRKSGRMFPTCSEVLEVILDLGYVKLSPAELAVVRPQPVEENPEDAAVEAIDDALEVSNELREEEPVA